jgi:phage terminase small subunit
MIEMKMKEVPTAPDFLDEVGAEYFKSYCKKLLQRGDLDKTIISRVAVLAWNEQCIFDLVGKMSDEGLTYQAGGKNRRSGYHTTYEKAMKDVKDLRKELQLAPKYEPEEAGHLGIGPPGKN